ncbi:MAG: leucyl/phenylalanyl-tRNA--protein transferase [Planctomycetota bacterium]
MPSRDRATGVASASRFPDPRESDPDGLVAVGGKLEPDWLLDAYRRGIFPWPQRPGEPMLWWSPDPRAIMPLDGLNVSRRLRRTIRSRRYRVTANNDFAGVLHGCATGPGREEGTWLFDSMRRAYQRIHELGHAHSVECWLDDRLVGGVYGVAIGGLFAGESMFHYATDASKVALTALVAQLRTRGYTLFDIQQWTPHTGRMGAVETARDEYLRRLDEALAGAASFGEFDEATLLAYASG